MCSISRYHDGLQATRSTTVTAKLFVVKEVPRYRVCLRTAGAARKSGRPPQPPVIVLSSPACAAPRQLRRRELQGDRQGHGWDPRPCRPGRAAGHRRQSQVLRRQSQNHALLNLACVRSHLTNASQRGVVGIEASHEEPMSKSGTSKYNNPRGTPSEFSSDTRSIFTSMETPAGVWSASSKRSKSQKMQRARAPDALPWRRPKTSPRHENS